MREFVQMNSFVEVAQCVPNVCASRTEQDLHVHTTHCKHNDGHYCDTSFSKFSMMILRLDASLPHTARCCSWMKPPVHWMPNPSHRRQFCPNGCSLLVFLDLLVHHVFRNQENAVDEIHVQIRKNYSLWDAKTINVM